ncbi:MAG TPA: hypothetical protein ENJ06_01280 [Phycisphaeraceae bacterium]|nr:hypothetical protein [Phycisphaeraceae bacterium]
MLFPVDDWQFWVVVGFFLGALYLVIRRLLPGRKGGCDCGCGSGSKKKKIELTIEGGRQNSKR